MLNMARIEPEHEMPVKIALVERGGCIVIQHYQVVWAMTFKAIDVQIPVSIAETLVNAVVPNGIEILTHKKCGFGTSEHIAVHTIGTHHNIIAKA